MNALVIVSVAALAVANPLPVARAIPSLVSDSLSSVPDDSFAFTLFTKSTPTCSRELATYKVFAANTDSLGHCQSVGPSTGSGAYSYFSLDILQKSTFPIDGIVLKFYSDEYCQFSKHEFSLADLKVDKCEKVAVGGSWKVLRPAANTQNEDTGRVEEEGISGESLPPGTR